MALLDTNVVSELRLANADPLVVQRVRTIKPPDTCLSAITVGELTYGARRLPAGARRRDLEAWIASVQLAYGNRILPVDATVAELWGEMTAASQAAGRLLAPQDGLIGATALRHGLHLMTRNTKDFLATGALVINPWEP